MKILGYGKALGDQIVTNDALSQIVDTSDEWIVQRTGIKQRHISSVETSELAYQSAIEALKNANLNSNQIDLIVVATITPDYITPSVANLLQNKLNISKPIMAFDINAACSGFIYALQVAESLLQNQFSKALVVGCEVMSKIIDFSDRNTCILFGDGAGAVVIEKSDKMNAYYTKSKGDIEALSAKAMPLNNHLNNKLLTAGFLQMNGREVFKFACNAIEESIHAILEMNQLTQDDIALIIPHQANQRIIDFVAKKMNIEPTKMFTNLHLYGNTSAASVAIALAEAKQSLPLNSKVILVGFGAGLTWGSTIITI